MELLLQWVVSLGIGIEVGREWILDITVRLRGVGRTPSTGLSRLAGVCEGCRDALPANSFCVPVC